MYGTVLGGEHAAEEGLHLVVQRGVRDPAIIADVAERWLLVLLCELLCRDRRYSLLLLLVVVVVIVVGRSRLVLAASAASAHLR